MPDEESLAGKILNVDDDAATRYTVTRALRHAGFDVVEAANGRDALTLARRLPELILLDIQLPDINGLEVCRMLKRDPLTARIPVLQISSTYVSSDDQAQGLNIGADAYLTHPVDPAVLTATTKALLRTRRAERSLAMEMDRLAATLKGIGDAVIATDANDCVILMNPVAERLTGWRQDEAHGRALHDVYRLIDADTRAPFSHRTSEGEEGAEAEQVAVLVARDDKERLIAENVSRVNGESGAGAGFVFVFRDITARRRTEEELAKAQKLESLGVLAGGIAHDFNNILTAILGHISLSRMPNADHASLMSEAEKACVRARHLTNQLLTFAQGGAPIRRPTTIPDLLRERTQFALRGSPIQANFTIAANLAKADVDPEQIGHVIHNLVINARDAMPSAGHLHISAENVEFPRSRKPLKKGHYIRVVVRDEGIGIAPEHIARVFDPFFTTKTRGSGLGLTSTYSILRKHGGHIEVQSEPGSGSTFSLYLPTSGQVAPEEIPSAPPRTGAGRILVMDDDDWILGLSEKLLRQLGYVAECARNGTEAIDKYRHALRIGEGYAAVILDLTVRGGMGGKECLATLAELDPAVIAVVSSGYSNDPVMSDPAHFGFAGVLAKPYRLEELSEVLAEALGRGLASNG